MRMKIKDKEIGVKIEVDLHCCRQFDAKLDQRRRDGELCN